MKAFDYVLSPALHIAEAKGIELPSGTSFAQFLLVHLTSEASFHRSCCLVQCLEEGSLSTGSSTRIYRCNSSLVC